MYDTSKIIPGLIIFFCLVSIPIWYNFASGQARYVPELEIATEEKHCIEEMQIMTTEHMDLLIELREAVVRQGNRTYIASDGKEYEISLNNTCFSCHSNKSGFCDRCHTYLGIQPNCWNCHNPP